MTTVPHTRSDDPFPMTDALARAWPCAVIMRGDSIVGAWFAKRDNVDADLSGLVRDSNRAGYDPGAPGHGMRSLTFEKPFVPRHLRSAGPDDLVALAVRSVSLSQGRGWLPMPVLSEHGKRVGRRGVSS